MQRTKYVDFCRQIVCVQKMDAREAVYSKVFMQKCAMPKYLENGGLTDVVKPEVGSTR